MGMGTSTLAQLARDVRAARVSPPRAHAGTPGATAASRLLGGPYFHTYRY